MKSTFITALMASGCAAHTMLTNIYVNGANQGQFTGIRNAATTNPITDVSQAALACNVNGAVAAPGVISAKAGDTITTEWHHGDKANPSDGDDPIATSHLGPTIAYVAKVSDAKTTNLSGLKWVKIFQDGLDSSGQWGVNRLLNTKGKFSFTLPSCLAPGQYLVRGEMIALHGAGSYPGAQLYVGCAQFNVASSGTANPAGVSLPGAYKGSDPGITFQLYWPKPTSYTVPGPAVFKC